MKIANWMKNWCACALTSALAAGGTASHEMATANETVFDATIPVLDMNEYFAPETKNKFVKELYDALKEFGFFAVVNAGVETEVLDQGYQVCFDFFSLSLEEKMKVAAPHLNMQRGYIPGESAKGSNFIDFKEFYHVGKERTFQQARALNSVQNVWPEGFNLKQPLNRLFGALEEWMIPLQAAMAEAIGMPSDFFHEMTVKGEPLLRAIHYPINPPADRLWAAEHTDIDLFTILPRATADGLQLLNNQGVWIDIRVPENAFIINGGDFLENITNGEFKSCLHRVVANSDGYERYSIVLFVHPHADDRLDPLPACIARTGGVRKYAKANRLDLLSERLVDLGLASNEMMKNLAESGFMERQIEIGRASVKAMQKLKEVGLATPAVLAELERQGVNL